MLQLPGSVCRPWRSLTPLSLCTWAICLAPGLLTADDWPQFRGPAGRGLAVSNRALPSELSPTQNVIWRRELPPGHSSPVVVGDRVYLTGIRDKQKLVTLALDRASGQVVWEREAEFEKLEEIHPTGSHATPTVAADGERVVSFFGSAGLFCHDPQGHLLWQIPLGPFKNDFGSGTSPLIVDDRVILCQDHDTDSFLMSVDKQTGRIVWRIDRGEFPRNYCTPTIWTVNGRKQIVVAATLRIVAYDFETGEEVWTVRGVARIVNMSPCVGADGNLYVATWSPGAEANDRINTPPYDELAAESDQDKNGTLAKNELPDGPAKQRFSQIDRNKDGQISRDEYESMRRVFQQARNVVLAIKPGGRGDITKSHVLWEYTRVIPYCPSPVVYGDHLYLIKNGGILTVLDIHTGKALKEGRIEATGDYYSSPVAGDGKVYLLSQKGQLTVLAARDGWDELSRADFGEDAYATPALVDGRIYLRTANHLYCFGLTKSE
ncbi:MAG: PQQ-binding-like beta-propeller repeat protein [Planctomycetaceae bacterium]